MASTTSNGATVDKLWHTLREIQRETSCSTKTIELIYERCLRPFLNLGPVGKKVKQFRSTDQTLLLHGCVDCNRFVFTPDDRRRHCPRCDHPRYDEKGKPFEVCWYFPLKVQLAGILKVSAFRELLMHEYERERNDKYMTDVYDT